MAVQRDKMWFRRGTGVAIEDVDAIRFYLRELDRFSGRHRIFVSREFSSYSSTPQKTLNHENDRGCINMNIKA